MRPLLAVVGARLLGTARPGGVAVTTPDHLAGYWHWHGLPSWHPQRQLGPQSQVALALVASEDSAFSMDSVFSVVSDMSVPFGSSSLGELPAQR